MEAQTIIKRLIAKGLSETAIADQVNSSQSAINRIKLGKVKRDPPYSMVVALKQLAKRK